MDPFVDTQMVNVLARFLVELRVANTILDRELYNKTSQVVDALKVKFMGLQQEPISLPDLLSYIITLWSSDTISLKEVGWITAATQELENLRS